YNARVCSEKLEDPLLARAAGREVPLVDDSSVPLAQLSETLEQLDLKIHTASNDQAGLRRLRQWDDEGHDLNEKLLMVFNDAEMPEEDGARLPAAIRNVRGMKDLYVVLHTFL